MPLEEVHLELAEALGEAALGKEIPGISLFEVASQYVRGSLPNDNNDRIRAARLVLKAASECVNNLKALEIAHVYSTKVIELLGPNSFS